MRGYQLLLTILFFASISGVTFCQNVKQDSTNFYTDISDQFILRLYTLTKLNTFSIIREPESYILAPNGQTNLGIGFNYKSVGLGISFGLPKSDGSDNIYGQTKRYDIQGSIYGKKFGGDGFIQGYKGYYNANPNDFVDWQDEKFPQIPDMQVISVGLTAFLIENSDEFSYRAAYVRNQIQTRNAGSFTVGIFANYDASKTDNGYIPQDLQDSALIQFDLKEFAALSLGLSVGYFYTFTFSSKFFVNIGAVPGFGYRHITLKDLNNSELSEDRPAGQVLIKTSLGYEHKHFYLGATGSVNFRNFTYKDFEFDLGTEQFRFILGKRFSLKKG